MSVGEKERRDGSRTRRFEEGKKERLNSLGDLGFELGDLSLQSDESRAHLQDSVVY